LQHEPRKPGEDAREDPISGTPEDVNTPENHLNLINVVQQNAVIITCQGVKGGRPEPDKSDSERWL
jgi:hypothetical protein